MPVAAGQRIGPSRDADEILAKAVMKILANPALLGSKAADSMICRRSICRRLA